MNDIICRSATELATSIRTRRLTSEQVVTAYLEHIEAVNPRINAITESAPDALRHARAADTDLAAGHIRGPLHGVPFTVKDVFATPGLYSRLDTHVRRRAQPAADATVVARLRAAGAVLIAKTNCPPNGSGFDTENATYGRTVNPYDDKRSPGGSSGGEAALVAAGGSPIGLGSDLSGGLRVPAHYCGVTTLKPTFGRVPNTGAYNQPGGLTDPRTQIGPIARATEDLLPLLRVIAGQDGQDSSVVPAELQTDAAVHIDKLRVACFAEDPAQPVDDEVRHAVGAAAQALARAGVKIDAALPLHFIVNSHEVNDFWQDMAGAPGRTWVELFAMWDYFRTDMLQFMQPYDAILCPVDHHAAPQFNRRDADRFKYTVPFSLTGQPCAVVRVGSTRNGMPIGVQIAAKHWCEHVAVALARTLEQAFGGWSAPVSL